MVLFRQWPLYSAFFCFEPRRTRRRFDTVGTFWYVCNCLKLLNIECRTRNRRITKWSLRHSIFLVRYSTVLKVFAIGASMKIPPPETGPEFVIPAKSACGGGELGSSKRLIIKNFYWIQDIRHRRIPEWRGVDKGGLLIGDFWLQIFSILNLQCPSCSSWWITSFYFT